MAQAAAAAKGGTSHSSETANDWIEVQKRNGSGERNGNGMVAPEQVLLGKTGTAVVAHKPLLPINSWHAILNTNPTSVFKAINEVQRANLQDYMAQTDLILTNFGRTHVLSFWLAATIQVALVQKI